MEPGKFDLKERTTATACRSPVCCLVVLSYCLTRRYLSQLYECVLYCLVKMKNTISWRKLLEGHALTPSSSNVKMKRSRSAVRALQSSKDFEDEEAGE